MPGIDSVYIDVAVGLAVAFFLLSLASSALNELVALATRLRSKFLWAYINHLFTEKDPHAKNGMVAREATLAMPPNAPSPDAKNGKPNAAPLPSSVGGLWRLMTATAKRSRNGAPADAKARPEDPRPSAGVMVRDDEPFVERLHRQLRPIDVGSAIRGRVEDAEANNETMTPSMTRRRTTVKHISPASFAQALLEVFAAADPTRLDVIENEVNKLAGTPIHASLAASWATSERRMAEFRDQIEHWFDAEMARLSGLYKRLTRWVLAIAAVIVALVVNLDPIALARDLWRDPDRRSDFIQLAETATEPSEDTDDDTDLARLVEACDVDTGVEEPTADDLAGAIESTRSCILDSLEEQRNLNLLSAAIFQKDRFVDSWQRDGVRRPFKVAIVAAALTVGAPFWYDIIRRLVGVRATLHRRET